MRTTLFEWADGQSMSLKKLSEMTGYSTRHLHRIKTGEYPVTETFAAGVVYRLGAWAKCLFFAPDVSERDEMSQKRDAEPAAVPA